MKLLIVDDSLIVRNVITRNALHEEITEIFQAENGARALEIYAEHQPELVTMDITMPQVDGLSCLKQIHAINPAAAVLVISALNSHKTAMEAIRLGACGFLVKPFTPPELSEALQDLIGYARGEDR